MNTIEKKQLIADLAAKFGSNVVARKDVIAHIKEKGMATPSWLINGMQYRAGRGLINLGIDTGVAIQQAVAEPEMIANVLPMRKQKVETVVENLVPLKDKMYVPFGFFKDLESILKSKVFYPVFITGLTGNGKTTMVEQVCAKLNRECIRVNVSIETDEDDLVGGSTLIDGNVEFREGPVLMAMRKGTVLLIDEIDRGSNKLMCIQGILEGKPYFIKKTGEVIHPAPGFTVIATANTKGQGSDSGKYIAAQILDDAFLERFPITVEQEYPNSKIELKIVMNNMNELNCVDEDFAEKLVNWAEVIRKTYIDNAIEEMVSTRRLVHIVKAFSMFKNRQKAIELCINRFDTDTKNAFLDLYKKMEAPKEVVPEPVAVETTSSMDEVPF